jgi:hypothetical protein
VLVVYTNSLLAALNDGNAVYGRTDIDTIDTTLPSLVARISGSSTFPAGVSTMKSDARPRPGQSTTKDLAFHDTPMGHTSADKIAVLPVESL